MTVQSWLDANGNYYEGDQQHPADVSVTRRPDSTCAWQNGAWAVGVNPPPPPSLAKQVADLQAAQAILIAQAPSPIQAQIASATAAK